MDTVSAKSGAFTPVVWAISEAPRLYTARGQLDQSAMLVLHDLALRADADGSNARPAVETMARRTGLTDETVRQALRRLDDAGLIAKEGVHDSGAVVWRLQLHMRRSEVERTPAEVARERKRLKARQRQADFRARRAEERRVAQGVTQSDSVSNAVGPRYVTRSDGENRPLDRPLTVPGNEGTPVGGHADARPAPSAPLSRPEPRRENAGKQMSANRLHKLTQAQQTRELVKLWTAMVLEHGGTPPATARGWNFDGCPTSGQHPVGQQIKAWLQAGARVPADLDAAMDRIRQHAVHWAREQTTAAA